MFVPAYGFLNSNKLSVPQEMILKAIDKEKGISVYRIGQSHGCTINSNSKIYVIEWGEKVIPFRHTSTVILANKVITIDRGLQPSLITVIPVCSIVVTDIGEDLKKLPRGRDENANYDSGCFSGRDDHSHKFSSQREYEEIVAVIKDAMPVLLRENYEDKYFDPLLCIEVIASEISSSLLLENNAYLLKRTEERNHYSNQNLKIKYICSNLKHGENYDITDANRKLNRYKKTPFWKAAKYDFDSTSTALERAGKLIKKFKKEPKTIDSLLSFLETQLPLPPVLGPVRLGDVEQNSRDRRMFFRLLGESHSSFLTRLKEAKEAASEQALQKADEMLEKIIPPTKDYKSRLKEFSDDIDSVPLTIENITERLLNFEVVRADLSGPWLKSVMYEELYWNMLQRSYNHHCQNIFSNIAILAHEISKTMTLRSYKREMRSYCMELAPELTTRKPFE